MKKLLIIILSLIMVLAFMAGCGNKNESSADSSNGAGAAVEEESAKGSGSDPGKALDQMIDRDAINAGDVSIDDTNLLAELDPEESQRAGSIWNSDGVVSAADSQN